MAVNFNVWMDDPVGSKNIQTAAQFAIDTQRENGFQPDTVASSIRVNTALRTATLIAVALINSIGSTSDIDVQTSLTDMQTVISNFLAGKANLNSPAFTGQPTSTTPSTSDDSTKIATTAFVKAVLAGMTTATVYTGSYTGQGRQGQSNPTTIGPIGISTTVPKVFFIWGDNSLGMAVWTGGLMRFESNQFVYAVGTGYSTRTIELYSGTGASAHDQFDTLNKPYTWVCLC